VLQAAILQQTAEYIYQLEQEKTQLLSQNCQLKRLVNQHEGGDVPIKKRKADTQGNSSLLITLDTFDLSSFGKRNDLAHPLHKLNIIPDHRSCERITADDTNATLRTKSRRSGTVAVMTRVREKQSN